MDLLDFLDLRALLGFERWQSANKGLPLGSVKDHLGSIGGVEASRMEVMLDLDLHQLLVCDRNHESGGGQTAPQRPQPPSLGVPEEGQTAPQRPQPPSLEVPEGGHSVQDRSGPRRSARGMDDRGDEHVAVPRKRMRGSSTGSIGLLP